MLRFLTSGESHGAFLSATLDGMVSHLKLSESDINLDLSRRQEGPGRGDRMKIEKDSCKIISGVRQSQTIGSPITVLIENKSQEKHDIPFTNLRPGHADLAGALKYNQKDLRDILERSSARETASRVAIGAICRKFLSEFEIKISSKVLSIGKASKESDFEKVIDEAKEKGDSLGGIFEIRAINIPAGLGSCMQWDSRLDGLLSQAIMSIQAIKGVEFGLGFGYSDKEGSKVHDEIFYSNNSFSRKTNNAGGLEGGMSNGEDIVIKAVMKPISTLRKPLKSVDLKTKKETEAFVERADTSAVHAAGVVGEAMTAFVLSSLMLQKFGGDSLEETKENFYAFKKRASVI